MKILGVTYFLFFVTIEALSNCLPISKIRPRLPVYIESCNDLPQESKSCIEGRQLFFTNDLSSDQSISCASCHKPNLAFTDKLKKPEARQKSLWVPRTPSLLDIHRRSAPFFWNGRAHSLTSAIFWPLHHPDELGASDETIEKFGGSHKIAKNISDFLKTLSTGRAAIDDYLEGNCQALTLTERTGLRVFLENCADCHRGTEFDGGIEEIKYKGLRKEYFQSGEATYLAQTPLHSGFKPIISLKSKVPSLRNIEAKGPPYGRFGQGEDLEKYLEYHIWQTDRPTLISIDELEEFLKQGLQSHSLGLFTKRTGSKTSKKARSTSSSSNRGSEGLLFRSNSGSGSK